MSAELINLILRILYTAANLLVDISLQAFRLTLRNFRSVEQSASHDISQLLLRHACAKDFSILYNNTGGCVFIRILTDASLNLVTETLREGYSRRCLRILSRDRNEYCNRQTTPRSFPARKAYGGSGGDSRQFLTRYISHPKCRYIVWFFHFST